MGRIERAPAWILKYRDRIERGAVTVEEILEEENRVRDKPIKLSTVTRAINALGFQTSGLHRAEESETSPSPAGSETAVAVNEEKKGSGPGWLQKYRERIENGTITVEEILEEENRIRDKPIKLSTVTRAINAMGFQTSGLHRAEESETSPSPAGSETAVAVNEEKKGSGPGWLQKYRERIENGTITVEEILEEENRIRDKPIKLSTLARALNIIGSARKKEEKLEMESEIRTRERTDFQSSIGEITEATKKRFDAIKGDWERDLGRTLHNDYFMNILLALAKLLGYGKTLAMKK
ncbi:MAG: hypothetical protein J7J01_02325 [Methanophagales archaeon]|nr:hypothetical protein [Methanophagales archaeon]